MQNNKEPYFDNTAEVYYVNYAEKYGSSCQGSDYRTGFTLHLISARDFVATQLTLTTMQIAFSI